MSPFATVLGWRRISEARWWSVIYIYIYICLCSVFVSSLGSGRQRVQLCVRRQVVVCNVWMYGGGLLKKERMMMSSTMPGEGEGGR